MSRDETTLRAGARLGSYEIVARLGAGGMGHVYRARDPRLGRDVALKVLPTEVAGHPDLEQRFEREARALAALSHAHICSVFDTGRENGVSYLVMEHLEGETLAHGSSRAGCLWIRRCATGRRSPTRSTRHTAKASCIAI
jgi:serine/threonine protein kinase